MADSSETATPDSVAAQSGLVANTPPAVVESAGTLLPVVVSAQNRRRWSRSVMLIVLLLAGGAGGYFYWRSLPPPPIGLGFGNGRIEADEIDIETKFPGRIAEVRVDEGDLVKQGQVLARMDTSDIEASLAKAQAEVEVSKHALDEASANLQAQQTQVTLASQELDRTTKLLAQGFATHELLDQRRQTYNGAVAGLAAAGQRVAQAERAIDAATHDVELYKVNISDNSLVAPKPGRIQYRLANTGEVLPAGGRVFTMLDVGYVYMDVYLPTLDVGKIKIGSDARITLDAYPNLAIPAKVSFIATQAQFTPKTVETKDERDKLMFRVRLKIDPDLLKAHEDAVRSGLPGLGYVKTDPGLAWPEKLAGNAK
jgi:HlyD family secretion protein